LNDKRIPQGFRLVRLIPVGNGSKRITLPKTMIDEVFGDSEYIAISKVKNGLRLTPVEVRLVKTDVAQA